ncbi:alcohol dehydrogenase [Raoultella ornithinolytica]|nr:alcohol dehydrogenase [Raoultella ornithinolytica]
MDAAKIMWVMYEHPETHFEDLALRFMDIRKTYLQVPENGRESEDDRRHHHFRYRF